MSSRQKMQSAVRESTATHKPAPARKTAPEKHAGKATKTVADSSARPAETPIPAKTAATEQALKAAADAKPAKTKAGTKLDEAAKPAKEARHKHKLVRDSFTMPREDFDLIHALKERALGFKRPTKKSELLRAGLQVLATLDDTALRLRLESLPTLSPGRPKKHR